MPVQLTFDLPAKSAQEREDFFVSAANTVAVETLENWRNWPGQKMALIGAEGSGKTHLSHVWAKEAGAHILRARELGDIDISTSANNHVAVEDVCQIAGNSDAEQILFHLHNLVLANGHSLLLTAQTAPAKWTLSLPDLESRMQGTPVVTLEEPDDALLCAVMIKLFSDRQIDVPPNLLPYLLRRMDRSFSTAKEIVDTLDKAALSRGCAVSRALAASVLDNDTRNSA
ncbi:DnaA ATPase domain-containing protein [Pseudohalocynthiibacter aestuariivivens]|jgi:chromosomal replication initiation ATPase DnaA|uniref:DnaA ATPase domain-containing protein n=1 Tax=Pseudohalocynthiibacter aestuariivivens TaxID=1591409 RepID=A0ABV5JCS7_9RHOB|nr:MULTISPECIES: DnaA/Hda family protein [Pseudohalocynthiibacter]MBS9715758.1 chromosomal replication initiator DnaA [Pseudohalocynthiibacter aestuariivivens]MCK0101371.1 DnaA/Hda family protein [Pseudohalocynthiibacter sp. F2068]